MKVIDLLNKIANGKDVPKKIKVFGEEFNYDGYDYYSIHSSSPLMSYVGEDYLRAEMNYDIEIIEEPQEHKIPEKIDIRQEKNIKNNWKWKVYGKEHSYNISTPQKIIADKINEILDYLEEIE